MGKVEISIGIQSPRRKRKRHNQPVRARTVLVQRKPSTKMKSWMINHLTKDPDRDLLDHSLHLRQLDHLLDLSFLSPLTTTIRTPKMTTTSPIKALYLTQILNKIFWYLKTKASGKHYLTTTRLFPIPRLSPLPLLSLEIMLIFLIWLHHLLLPKLSAFCATSQT